MCLLVGCSMICSSCVDLSMLLYFCCFSFALLCLRTNFSKKWLQLDGPRSGYGGRGTDLGERRTESADPRRGQEKAQAL